MHNLSFFAGNSEIANGATDRSIWMLTRKEADELGLKHLDPFEQVGPPVVDDAALLSLKISWMTSKALLEPFLKRRKATMR